MRHVRVILEHPIFTGFRGLTGCQRDPRDRGVEHRLPQIDGSQQDPQDLGRHIFSNKVISCFAFSFSFSFLKPPFEPF